MSKFTKRMAAISAVSKISGHIAQMEADKRMMARKKDKIIENKKCHQQRGGLNGWGGKSA